MSSGAPSFRRSVETPNLNQRHAHQGVAGLPFLTLWPDLAPHLGR